MSNVTLLFLGPHLISAICWSFLETNCSIWLSCSLEDGWIVGSPSPDLVDVDAPTVSLVVKNSLIDELFWLPWIALWCFFPCAWLFTAGSPIFDNVNVFTQIRHHAFVLSIGSGSNQSLYSSLFIQSLLNLTVIVNDWLECLFYSWKERYYDTKSKSTKLKFTLSIR